MLKGIVTDNLDTGIFPALDTWQADPLADYGGTDRKDGLISPDGERYLIKYSEAHSRINDLDTSYINNVVSEYISSHILSIVGFATHETFLATRFGELIVACKNFTGSDLKLIEFSRFMRKRYDSGEIGRVPVLHQVVDVISDDPILKSRREELLESYWELFVGDAFVGNFDRHKGNWGYLIKADGSVSVAPIYDNGSTLFPNLSEKAMKDIILSNPKEIMKRTLLFPKAALEINGEKVGYYDMLSSGYDDQATNAVIKVVPMIADRLDEVYAFIDSQQFLSEVRKDFYKTMLKSRYDNILVPAYRRCVNREFDMAACERINNGISYKEEMFENDFEKLHQVDDVEEELEL